jgi:3,4-dihydroxy 2-butanone 4-phosphate synthase/GTP cyclohydrolase II
VVIGAADSRSEVFMSHRTHPVEVCRSDDSRPRAWTSGGTQFSTVPQALHAIAAGQIVVVVDDENRENEGDLIMAAQFATTETVATFVRYTSGVLCVAMTGERLDQLQLPLMVAESSNADNLGTAFTVSVDVIAGTSTGISAADRALTAGALASAASVAHDFARPGHVFPLRARSGGVLKRAGHTEAGVDLCSLAGCQPAALLAEVVSEDGSMARLPELRTFAAENNMPLLSIADLVRWRMQSETLVRPLASAPIPATAGEFVAHAFESLIDGVEHVALVYGNIGGDEPVLVRVHSECITGDVFGSRRCDCGSQLQASLRLIADHGRGVLVYLRGHEGRGIGLGQKLRAYGLQDQGHDTIDANLALGLPVDSREYGIGAQILVALGVSKMNLITNNPAKYIGLSGYGLEIVDRVPIAPVVTTENLRYLRTKRDRMGHDLTSLSVGADQPAAR